MKSRFKPTLVAFIVLVLLLVYANYYETDEIPEPGMQKPQKLVDIDPDKIETLTWKTGDKETLKLQREDGKFKVVVPGSYDVEKDEVDGIIRHFAELKSEMLVAENASDTAAFGITERSPFVAISGAGKSFDLLLGAKSPVGGSYYVAYKDQAKVFMVPGYIRGDFYKTADNVRNRSAFPEKFGNIKQIKLVANGSKLLVQKRDAIEWYIEKPTAISANAEAVVGLIQALQNLRISRFVDETPENLAPWGFASPTFSISMTNEAGKVFYLETGEVAGTETYYRTGPDAPIHAILNTDLQNLQKTFNDLRTKLLPEVNYSQLEALRLKDASGTIELSRKADKWLFAGQIMPDADVKAFVDAYENARVDLFLGPDKMNENGLSQPSECPSFEIAAAEGTNLFILGTVEGANLSLLHENEILVVNAELNNAFKTLIARIRAATSENPVISGSDPD